MSTPSENELLEVFRLGELAGDGDIVRACGDVLAGVWFGRSRFRETGELTARSLEVQTSPGTLNQAARAREVLGDPRGAIAHFEEALIFHRRVGDRPGEATILNNLGHVCGGLGDRQRALACYHLALPIRRDIYISFTYSLPSLQPLIHIIRTLAHWYNIAFS